MELITFETETYKQLTDKLDKVIEFMNNLKISSEITISTYWVRQEQAMKLLDVSSRTMQTYRDKRLLGYSQVKGKIYYKMTEINRFLESYHKESIAKTDPCKKKPRKQKII